MILTTINRAKELNEVETQLLEIRFQLRQQALIGGRVCEVAHMLIQLEREKLGGMPCNLKAIRLRIKELTKNL